MTFANTHGSFDKLKEIYNNYHSSPEVIAELRQEKAMQLRGRRRYLKRLDKNKNLSATNAALPIVDKYQVAVTKYLDSVIAGEDTGGKATESNKSGAGRKFTWYNQIQGIETSVMAVIALSIALNAVGRGQTVASTLVEMGRGVEMEQWGRWLRDQDNELEKRLYSKVMRDHTSRKYREQAMKNIAMKEGHIREPWTKETCVKVGSLLLNAVCIATDVFDTWDSQKHTARGVKTSRRMGLQWVDYDARYNGLKITMSDDNKRRLEEFNENASWLEPMFTPMTVQPIQWQTFDDLVNNEPHKRTAGMYLDSALGAQVPIVRGASAKQRKLVKEAIADGSMSEMVRALNLIQNTPFEINVPVLEAVEWAWANNKTFAKFPHAEKLDKIPFPDDWENMDKLAKKGWVLKARELFQKNREIDGGLALKLQDLRTARSLANLPTKAFWVGASWDFRGRVYPVANFSHQRGDHIKSMLLLHNKKPIGEEGLQWLAIKCADLGDFDRISKASIEDRLAWVNEHQEQLREVAVDFKKSFDGTDPTKLYWSQADKPFGFLAACFELHNVMTYGYEYESGFPVGLDGSNSGLQHFSALSLAEEEGKLTGLVPSDKPLDLYESVASVVRAKIEADTSVKDKDIRDQWMKHKVTRSTIKRNVMVKSYGSNLYGFTQQIKTDFMKPINDAITTKGDWKGYKTNPFSMERFDKETGESVGMDRGDKSAHYLAKKSWDAVNEVVKSANEGMSFIQQLCDACSNENKMMTWTTPLGFPVVNRYTKKPSKAIKVYLYDREYGDIKRSQVTIRHDEQRTVDARKANAAVAANHTHALDSAHLHSTVLECFDNYGIKDFFLIHDSFATCPADTVLMFKAVREAFIKQYEGDCLYQHLKDQVVEQLEHPEKADLPEVPAKGTLDLQQIIESDYCFL